MHTCNSWFLLIIALWGWKSQVLRNSLTHFGSPNILATFIWKKRQESIYWKKKTLIVNSLTTKKQMTNCFVCKFSKNIKSKLYHIENSKTRGHHEPPHQDLNSKARGHHEPPRQDLCCLHIQLFSSLVLKEWSTRDENSQIFKLSRSWWVGS